MPFQNDIFTLWFILSCMATFRLSLMVSKESGPMRVFRKLRRLPPEKSSLKEGLSCQWCQSVWWSAPITYLSHRLFPMGWEQLILYFLAVSSGAIVINQAFTRS